MNLKISLLIISLVGMCVSNSIFADADRAKLGRPNILLIVADDLALTDLGSYGGEIQTPNIDQLALEGARFTHFYANPSCSPTRATLLTGIDSHLAGLATMQHTQTPGQKGQPGYEGYLNKRVVTLPTLLRDAGYQTYMAGKWHLGMTEDNSPASRGFERSFALLPGGGGHFTNQGLTSSSPALYRRDGALVNLPKDFYSSRFYSDQMVEYLTRRDKTRPFFAYLSYTAPHWPLQAPKESIARYSGRYSRGFEVLHNERRQRATLMGLSDLVEGQGVFNRQWSDLTDIERQHAARTMEVYAAMVDDMDHYLGRVLSLLRDENALDNTMILILSDNGAEGHDLFDAIPEIRNYVEQCCDNTLDNIGEPDSYISYGHDWARAGVGSFRGFKTMPLEGGVRVPFLLRYPPLLGSGGQINRQRFSVEDVVPGLLELAGVKHPDENYKGRTVYPLTGKSFLPILSQAESAKEEHRFTLVRELFGRVAVWHDKWKLVLLPFPFGDGEWRLFNLSEDPSESTDIASKYPDKVKELILIWEEYRDKNNVIAPGKIMNY
ncbi:arylsulfatase [Zhongshania aquimaris]|uniref:Sulfatase-like hydrolase/transferase n=1 Tax=Zhongshania aquimaris TaxID=2857107 RepID=A0ABS6VPC0_9GAMM|nr:sulfatase-like hydrolase/transferase [Zhongshania aquimaris]MBW2939899.1 sulfatase-like hydrolase/transferase [Zhongshania aquimaris]